MLESLPHVGSIISGEDGERIVRLIKQVREIVEERAARLQVQPTDTTVKAAKVVNIRSLFMARISEGDGSMARAVGQATLHRASGCATRRR